MSHHDSTLDRLIRALTDPKGGVLGLVDDLLAISLERPFELDWQAGCCQVRLPHGTSLDPVEVPMPKSVGRAVLARIAALCNERNPGSVSPYGGQAELAVDHDPGAVVRVSFANTPESQHLELDAVMVRASLMSADPII